MAYPYIDTPRTEVDANATYLTNGYRSVGRHNLSALDSVENSFQTPSKDDDVLKVMGDGRRRSTGGSKLNTPRATTATKPTRSALNSRQQLPSTAVPKGEFTPMLRSAVKNNYMKNIATTRGVGGPKTPAYLRASYRSNVNTPGLPAMDMTGIDEEDATVDDSTPLPQVASSSVQSTPLAGLASRNGGGVLNDGSNMTLKEQEKIIDKLDKDNFGLKLKIHFLQEQLEKAGPAYNQAALVENTELKVSKLTMQRDISRYKKSLQQAERDLEAYRQQFQELREKMRRRQTDETIQRDMDLMREEIESRDQRVRDLQEQLRDVKDSQSQEFDKLRDDIEDLEASLREKDRLIEEREEEIEELKDKGSQENDALSELESELRRAREQLEELQESLEEAKYEARQARNAQEQAEEGKKQADENLQELHDEMANKSISTNGLTRQLEEKSGKLEEEISQLRQENTALKEELESRTRKEISLEEQTQKAQQSLDEAKQKLLEDLAQVRRERELAYQERDRLSAQLQAAQDDIQRKQEERDLLHTRHHALTDESGNLQGELARSQSEILELRQTLDAEKERSAENMENVRSQYLEDIERLQEEIEGLHHEIEDKEGRFALEEDRWESTKRSLQLQKDRAEDQAAGFKRTIEKLEQVEYTLTGKEAKLQDVIDSEKERHFNAEAVLSRQVKELNDDLSSKREAIDQLRSEALSVKEELRLARRAESNLKEKIQALEDEVVVLQSSLEEEQQYAKGRGQKGSAEQEGQLQKIVGEKQKLRDQLANAHVELHDLKAIKTEIEAERDELQVQLQQVQSQVEDTTKFDKEKVELRKSSLRVESELKRLKDDKLTLLETKESLEQQLSSEIERAALEENRLSAEIEQLQDKLHTTSGGRDRELALAKSKLSRFERRIHELEELLEQPPPVDAEQPGAAADLSALRHNLDEVRKREKALLQREADQKSSIRTYKSRVVELERELHDALIKKYEIQSPSSSPSNKFHEEVRNLRKQLSDAHRSLRELKSKNHGLERAAMREEDQRDLHELLKQSTLEAETLALQVSEREAQLSSTQAQMRRIRDERASCARKAESAAKELELLHDRYKQAMEKAGAKGGDLKTRHEKEILGLGKEILWLRARLKREEKFRRDLAWSKGLMELGERVRVACNEADLRMISDMGVKPRDRSQIRSPHAKLKTAVSMVKAIVRMQRMGREWKKAKKIGEGLKRAKHEVIKRRETSAK
ncbi:spindle-pole body protein [Aspergillus rambellii]|uniref:Spindle-pole body protein n=2 Tax=Aspergillus subgen. Nidulantes TaxID=2720870 RepID=A0A0F8V024_9EURO|nr:spindle-pole body protein [Aspergillus rambellii]